MLHLQVVIGLVLILQLMDCVINIYVAQNITIGTGGSITILGKAVTESLLEGVMLECVYNGTDWDIYRNSVSRLPTGIFHKALPSCD